MLYRISTILSFLFFKHFFTLEVKGKDSIPGRENFILASNHLSNLDPPLLASVCPRRIAFAAKKELFRNKLFALYLKAVGAVPVERKKASTQTLRILLSSLKARPLLIFPEGSRGAGLEKARAGAGFLCKKSKASVIAVKISGTDKVFKPGKIFPQKTQIKVSFSPVLEIKPDSSPEEITKKIINTLKNI